MKLKPCPFCGNKTHFQHIKDSTKEYSVIRCEICSAFGSVSCKYKSHAEKAWNKRQDDIKNSNAPYDVG